MAKDGELNIRQSKFVDLYIETGNASQSYLQAGYGSESERCTVDSNACTLVRNQKVSQEIARRREECVQSSRIKLETKRIALWKIYQEHHETNPRAATDAIAELNRMDGHRSDSRSKLVPEGFTFDAELMPPDDDTE